MKEKIGFLIELSKGIMAFGIAGSISLYRGIKKSRLRRRILDIPRSKIKSAAIGTLVELEGRVLGHKQFEAPVSKRISTAFILKLEQHTTDKNGRTVWRELATIFSDPYLILGDDDGENFALELSQTQILDDDHKEILEFRFDKLEEQNKTLFDILNSTGKFPKKSLTKLEGFLSDMLFEGTHRVIEYSFSAGDKFFLFGATHPPHSLANYTKSIKTDFLQDSFQVRINIAREANTRLHNPEIIKETDINNDGYLTEDEVELLQNKIQQESDKENVTDYPFRINFIMTRALKGSLSFATEEVLLSSNNEKLTTNKVFNKMLKSLVIGYILLGITALLIFFAVFIMIKS